MTGRAHACVSGERVHAKAELARYLYPHPHKGQSTNRPKKVVGNVTRYRNTRWRRIRLHPVHVQFPFPSPCPFHRLCLAHNDQCTALHLSLDKGRTIKTLGRPIDDSRQCTVAAEKLLLKLPPREDKTLCDYNHYNQLLASIT